MQRIAFHKQRNQTQQSQSAVESSNKTADATVQGPARGLINYGNTCFLNSCLQGLAATPPLVQYLAERTMARQCKCDDKEPCMICRCAAMLVGLQSTTKQGAYGPRIIAYNPRLVGKQFRAGRQEDSHEFLRCLLYAMHRVALAGAGVKEGQRDRLDETTFVYNIFGGYFQNTISCPGCGFASNTFDSFLDMSLEVGNGIRSVPDALRHFTATETLDENNKWRCPHCKHHVRARKRMTIRKPPPILTLQLKRFSFTPRAPKELMARARRGDRRAMFELMRLSGGQRKLTDVIAFSDRLSIAPALSAEAAAEGAAADYTLYGIVVHHGHSSQSGHYFAYTKAPSGQWHCMNDESVHASAWPTVAQQQAYMLFYAQVPQQPPPKLPAAAAAVGVQPLPGLAAAAVVACGSSASGGQVTAPAAAAPRVLAGAAAAGAAAPALTAPLELPGVVGLDYRGLLERQRGRATRFLGEDRLRHYAALLAGGSYYAHWWGLAERGTPVLGSPRPRLPAATVISCRGERYDDAHCAALAQRHNWLPFLAKEELRKDRLRAEAREARQRMLEDSDIGSSSDSDDSTYEGEGSSIADEDGDGSTEAEGESGADDDDADEGAGSGSASGASCDDDDDDGAQRAQKRMRRVEREQEDEEQVSDEEAAGLLTGSHSRSDSTRSGSPSGSSSDSSGSISSSSSSTRSGSDADDSDSGGAISGPETTPAPPAEGRRRIAAAMSADNDGDAFAAAVRSYMRHEPRGAATVAGGPKQQTVQHTAGGAAAALEHVTIVSTKRAATAFDPSALLLLASAAAPTAEEGEGEGAAFRFGEGGDGGDGWGDGGAWGAAAAAGSPPPPRVGSKRPRAEAAGAASSACSPPLPARGGGHAHIRGNRAGSMVPDPVTGRFADEQAAAALSRAELDALLDAGRARKVRDKAAAAAAAPSGGGSGRDNVFQASLDARRQQQGVAGDGRGYRKGFEAADRAGSGGPSAGGGFRGGGFQGRGFGGRGSFNGGGRGAFNAGSRGGRGAFNAGSRSGRGGGPAARGFGRRGGGGRGGGGFGGRGRGGRGGGFGGRGRGHERE